ncbi:MAG TPA: calcium/sodium antiporter [Myxococcota bacterium]|nr:calcium/sodium antiporter [Myxococcota bacterium]
MLLDASWLALGLLLLLTGGELLVRASASLAGTLGVSPLMIGLTVVAFGTSAPELAVTAVAALEGRGGIAFGNVVGSNLANVGLVIGGLALLRPIQIRGALVAREIPMMLLATAAAIVLASDAALDAAPDLLSRGDGLALLLFFGVFLYYTIGDLARQRARARASGVDVALPAAPFGVAASTLLLVVGLALLLIGAERTVFAATRLARALGASDGLIGLTLVAIGTSLPELAASGIAIARRQSEIALGNLIGSNIFNLLFVLGVSTILRPIAVPAAGRIDLYFAGALSLLLLAVALTASRRITRFEGALLLGAYLGYLGWRTLGVAS